MQRYDIHFWPELNLLNKRQKTSENVTFALNNFVRVLFEVQILDFGRFADADGCAVRVMEATPPGSGRRGERSPGFRSLFEAAQPGVIKDGTPPGFSTAWCAGWLRWLVV